MRETNLELLDRLEICGLTQRSAAAYLLARGRKASFGSVQAWAKSLYSVPPEVIDDLELLRRIIWDTDALEDDKGVPLPEGCLARRRQVRRTKPLKPADFSALQRLMSQHPEAEPPRDDD